MLENSLNKTVGYSKVVTHIFDDLSVSELFEQQVVATPENIAVSELKEALTYQQLNEKANQLAHWLLQEGVKPNDFVALLLEPGCTFIIWILAVIKAGGVYLPLDVLAPGNRINEILNNAKPLFLITQEKFYSIKETEKIITVLADDILKKISHFPVYNLIPLSISKDPIYMLYTSGSTGNPKGVIVPHCAVVNLVKTVNYFGIPESKVVAQFSNLSFDGSTVEIWSALLNGGTLAIISQNDRKNYVQLEEFFSKFHVEYLFLPTAYFHEISRRVPKTLDCIKVLIFGGESANSSIISNFINYRKKNKLPITLINGYGPTEATVFTCRNIIDEKNEVINNLGKTIDNVKLYILDGQKKLVSNGEIGELYISGINLALGYYNNEILNKEKFMMNPFDFHYPFQRLYKTGDLVKLLPDGNLEYIGRVDDQIKVQGFRVHLGEVENQLSSHSAIDAVTVIAEKDNADRNQLIAYVVLSKGTGMTSYDIRKFLANRLPPYMLPVKYIQVNELPLSAIGKIDKKKLAKIQGTDLADKNIILPVNSIEKQLKVIISRSLSTDYVDVTKNFFDLGVNSLLLVEICSRISQQFQWPCQPAAMISYPTIRKLSRYLQQQIDSIKGKYP